MNIPEVIVQRIDPTAQIPCKPKSFDDAGWDVYPNERVVIPAGRDALIGTGLKFSIPKGYCIQVNPRSGKAVKDKLGIGARVIDSPYRGELKIHVINRSDKDYEVSKSDPIAQLLVLQCISLLVEGEITDDTERGEDGFGSTDGVLKSSRGTVPSAPSQPELSLSRSVRDKLNYSVGTKTKVTLEHWEAASLLQEKVESK